jgi:hypothetical protein
VASEVRPTVTGKLRTAAFLWACCGSLMVNFTLISGASRMATRTCCMGGLSRPGSLSRGRAARVTHPQTASKTAILLRSVHPELSGLRIARRSVNIRWSAAPPWGAVIARSGRSSRIYWCIVDAARLAPDNSTVVPIRSSNVALSSVSRCNSPVATAVSLSRCSVSMLLASSVGFLTFATHSRANPTPSKNIGWANHLRCDRRRLAVCSRSIAIFPL